MTIGNKNIRLGIGALIIAACFGFYLGFSIVDHLVNDSYSMNMARITLRGGHTHGMLIGLFNIVLGIMLNHLPFPTRSRQIASWLGVVAFLLPIGLFLRGLTDGAMTFAPVAMIGALGLLGSLGVMLIGYGKAEKLNRNNQTLVKAD